MKLTFFLLFLGLFEVHASLHAQIKTVNLEVKDMMLKEVFHELKKQTQMDFFFSNQVLDVQRKVTISVQNAELSKVLSTILGEAYQFEIQDGIVIIRPALPQDVLKSITVQGVVKDIHHLPLPGVTVLLKGTNMGVSTDEQGRFSITVSDTTKAEFIFSFIGMKTQTLAYAKRDKHMPWTITMKEDTREIEEVVVTGYGDISKGNYTGAVTTVKAEDIIIAGATSIDQMLQGIVPGMLVQTRSGMVGSTPKIRVRGTSTLLGSQEPVWVVDGVIQRNPQPFNVDDNTKFTMDADDISKLAGNAISWLNPYDIETITILKDASATAIYGSQAANGVIVIKTKKAQSGQLRILYNGDFSIGQRPSYRLYDRMNSQENMAFSKEMYEDRVNYPNPILPIGYPGLVYKMQNKEMNLEEMNKEYQRMANLNTDWFKLLFRNSFNHKHSLSMSGGSDIVQNRTSININQEKGEARGNDLFNLSMMSNTTVRVGNNLTINWLLNGGIRKVDGFAYGIDPFNYAYNTTRVIPVYNEDGTYFYHEKWGESSQAIEGKSSYNYNVLNELENTGSINDTKNWGTTLDLTWRLLPGLQYQGVVSYASSSAEVKKHATENSFYITQYRGYESGTVVPNSLEESGARIPHGGLLERATTVIETMTLRNSFVYNHLFQNKHQMVLQAGMEMNATKTSGGSNERYGYLRDRGETFTNVPIAFYSYGKPEYRNDNSRFAYGANNVLNRKNNLLSGYLQGVYTYDNRYVLNISARVDASNRFAQDENKRFAPTWSTGLKWRVGNESLLQNKKWLNSLDITLSYGYQGNAVESVSPYLIARNGGLNEHYQSYTLRAKSLPYPNLGWEKTKTYNLGIEASFLNGRLNGMFNYYRKDSDVLSSRDVPYENGIINCVVSGSEMRNIGYEFVVEVVPIKTANFSWSLSLNSSSTRNKISKNDRVNTLKDYLSGTAVVEGAAFSTFYSFDFKELDSKNGNPLFHKMDIENANSPIDFLVESGKFTPDFSGGLNTMLKYRNWTLYALFSLQWGGSARLPELYQTGRNLGVPTPEQNPSRQILNRWRKAGDEKFTKIPSIPRMSESSIYIPQTKISEGRYLSLYEMYNQSNYRVANTDMIRCNSLSVGYDFNLEFLEKLAINRLALKATMMNPFMWVKDNKWEGLDPETGNWPARRITSFSLQVVF